MTTYEGYTQEPMQPRLIEKYNFRAGDMVIDSVTGERGILISRKRMIGDMYQPSPLYVWMIRWFPCDPARNLSLIWHPKEYPEHTLMMAIEEGDLSYYESPKEKPQV
jgi:hypothetical protein